MHDRQLDIAPGLRLRPWCVQDLPALLRHADDPQVARGLSERFPSPYTLADGEAFLRGEVVDLSHALAIEWQGEACGGIGLRPSAVGPPGSAELGYWLGKQHWGKGIMTRAVGALLPRRVDTRCSSVMAQVLPSNTASARVLQKSGFVELAMRRRITGRDGQVHEMRVFCWPACGSSRTSAA